MFAAITRSVTLPDVASPRRDILGRGCFRDTRQRRFATDKYRTADYRSKQQPCETQLQTKSCFAPRAGRQENKEDDLRNECDKTRRENR